MASDVSWRVGHQWYEHRYTTHHDTRYHGDGYGVGWIVGVAEHAGRAAHEWGHVAVLLRSGCIGSAAVSI